MIKNISTFKKATKIFVSLICTMVILLTSTGCAAGKTNNPAENESNANGSSVRIIRDMSGSNVKLPKEINRVVCIQPTLTEYMIGFGAGDKLVGTHKNSLNKVWLQRVYPQVSELKAYGYSPTAEDILAIQADLVIVPNNEAAEPLRAAGIPTVVISLNDPDETYQHIKLLGEVIGGDMPERINSWIDEVEEVRAEINNALDQSNIDEGPNVYMVNAQSDKGIFYPQGGGGSALESYLNGIRGVYALRDFPANGNLPTEEEILATNPDVILIGGAYGVPLKQSVFEDPVWADISAIKNNRVYNVPIGGIGWDQGYIALPVELKFWANVLYPDIFQYDLTEDTISFYTKYFGAELSEQEVEYMMNGLTPEGTPSWES